MKFSFSNVDDLLCLLEMALCCVKNCVCCVTAAKEGGLRLHLCLSVCLFANRITQTLLLLYATLYEILWICWTKSRDQSIRFWV